MEETKQPADAEIIQQLEDKILQLAEELDEAKNPIYCPECGACGEDGCCKGSMCKHNRCLYGESYAMDYRYNSLMADRLFEALYGINTELASDILSKTWDEIYKGKIHAKPLDSEQKSQ